MRWTVGWIAAAGMWRGVRYEEDPQSRGNTRGHTGSWHPEKARNESRGLLGTGEFPRIANQSSSTSHEQTLSTPCPTPALATLNPGPIISPTASRSDACRSWRGGQGGAVGGSCTSGWMQLHAAPSRRTPICISNRLGQVTGGCWTARRLCRTGILRHTASCCPAHQTPAQKNEPPCVFGCDPQSTGATGRRCAGLQGPPAASHAPSTQWESWPTTSHRHQPSAVS